MQPCSLPPGPRAATRTAQSRQIRCLCPSGMGSSNDTHTIYHYGSATDALPFGNGVMIEPGSQLIKHYTSPQSDSDEACDAQWGYGADGFTTDEICDARTWHKIVTTFDGARISLYDSMLTVPVMAASQLAIMHRLLGGRPTPASRLPSYTYRSMGYGGARRARCVAP